MDPDCGSGEMGNSGRGLRRHFFVCMFVNLRMTVEEVVEGERRLMC